MPLHLVPDELPLEDLLATDCRGEQVILAVLAVVGESNKLELVWAVLVEEADGDSHDAATPFS